MATLVISSGAKGNGTNSVGLHGVICNFMSLAILAKFMFTVPVEIYRFTSDDSSGAEISMDTWRGQEEI